ncbi:hypothetical protein G6F62_014366 [Rhizopus arrhizus]|nr:hypothetical protein G6F62_014366 [Rhizopus arrhizus]
MSGSYSSGQNDYYRCSQLGYALRDEACSFYKTTSVYSEKSGNPDLKPITADVWSAGVVWAPVSNFSLSADYYNWKIKNEVNTLSSDQLLLAEYYCRNGLSNTAGATWIYNGSTLWSFATPANITRKMGYVKTQGRGGAFVWEFSGDDAQGTLTKAVSDGLK